MLAPGWPRRLLRDALAVPAGINEYWQMPASLRRGDMGEALFCVSGLSVGDRDRGAPPGGLAARARARTAESRPG